MEIVLLCGDHAECNQGPLKDPLTLHQQNNHSPVFVSILLEYKMIYKMIFRQKGKQIEDFQ